MAVTALSVVKALAVPGALAAFVLGMGLSGKCPLCASVVGACGLTGSSASAAVVALADEAPANPPAAAPASPRRPAESTPAAPPSRGPMHAPIFADFDDKPVAFEDAAGKPMLIEMWATWCGPCRRQREHMHTLSAEFPDVTFVAASVDEKGPGAVRIFLAEHPSPKTSRVKDVMATPEFRALVRKRETSRSIPQVIYVDKQGRIAEVALGAQNPEFMRAMLKNLSK